jgi:hypothetical protein
MSSSRPHCRTSFTPQQIAKSLATLFNLRPELVHDGLPAPYDCNGNGVRDDCDIASGTSEDANSNGIPDECEAQPGDLNCDGVVDFGDINPFVLYLSSVPGWQAAYPDCPAENGDINQDGSYPSLGDINPFVALLAS